MASEDSVENVTLWNPSVLAVSIDGVGKVDEFDYAFETAMPPLTNKVDSGREDLVVDYARREAHVVLEEWDNSVPQDLAIRDLENQHIFVPAFGKDRAGAKLLRSQFQELSSVPVLIQKEHRLDEVAERSSRMSLQRHTNAAFSFNEAG